jgi:hypothetical protein
VAETPAVTGDELLALLGMAASSLPVQLSLATLARGMQPELDPDDEQSLADWVTVNEIGLEYGFEDEALVRARDVDERRQGKLLLTQLYFYGDTPTTLPFPYPLPFGLSFEDDRAAARRRMARHETSRRSYIRDAWTVEGVDVTVAYHGTGALESVFCQVPCDPWPQRADEPELLADLTPQKLAGLFGLRWSGAALREALGPVGFGSTLADIRTEHNADLRMAHGIEFGFAPGRQVPAADPQFPRSASFASVTYYGARVLDAREWAGPMPFGLRFADSQETLAAKVGRKPDDRGDQNLTGFVAWHFDAFTLHVEYSNVLNRLLRISLMAPGYWAASGAAEPEAAEA